MAIVSSKSRLCHENAPPPLHCPASSLAERVGKSELEMFYEGGGL